MWTVNSPELSRSYGFVNEAEQQAVLDSGVAIAGVGGDGFHLGLRLLAMGVQRLDIADPEVFEAQNANRVPGATVDNYGRNKAVVFKERALAINPDADIRIFTEGITEANIETFVSRADVTFDESELTHLELGTMLAREARKQGKPNVLLMNVGHAAVVTSFDPRGKFTFERLMGVPNGAPLDEVAEMDMDLSRCLPYIPPYGDIRTLIAIGKGAPLPSIAQGVDVAAALGASQAFLHMTKRVSNKRQEPIWAPRMGYMDSLNLRSGITRHPRLSHYGHLAIAATRSVVGLNPRSSYVDQDRLRRDKERAIETIRQQVA